MRDLLVVDDDVVELARRHADALGVNLAALGHWRTATPAEFLDRYAPTWGPTWGGAQARLAEIPEVRRVLEEVWDPGDD